VSSAPPTWIRGRSLSVTVTRVPKTLIVAIGVFEMLRKQFGSVSQEAE
jgi:hypothetical protein